MEPGARAPIRREINRDDGARCVGRLTASTGGSRKGGSMSAPVRGKEGDDSHDKFLLYAPRWVREGATTPPPPLRPRDIADAPPMAPGSPDRISSRRRWRRRQPSARPASADGRLPRRLWRPTGRTSMRRPCRRGSKATSRSRHCGAGWRSIRSPCPSRRSGCGGATAWPGSAGCSPCACWRRSAPSGSPGRRRGQRRWRPTTTANLVESARPVAAKIGARSAAGAGAAPGREPARRRQRAAGARRLARRQGRRRDVAGGGLRGRHAPLRRRAARPDRLAPVGDSISARRWPTRRRTLSAPWRRGSTCGRMTGCWTARCCGWNGCRSSPRRKWLRSRRPTLCRRNRSHPTRSPGCSSAARNCCAPATSPRRGCCCGAPPMPATPMRRWRWAEPTTARCWRSSACSVLRATQTRPASGTGRLRNWGRKSAEQRLETLGSAGK